MSANVDQSKAGASSLTVLSPALDTSRLTRLLSRCVWLYFLGVLVVTGLLLWASDEWWVASLILFGPRWIWALPLGVLAPAAWMRRRRLLWPLSVAALPLLFSVNSFEVPSLAVLVRDDQPRDVRVMTYNIGGGNPDPAALAPLLEEIAPDVALFQECDNLMTKARSSLEQRGWHVDIQWSSCIASRYPIRKIDRRDSADVWKMGGSGAIVLYEIELPGLPINIVNVHLETVREGLAAVMRRAWRGAPELEANIQQRDFESGLGRGWTERARGPLVITGDFNMPLESAIYRRHWSSFTNAFSEAGFGFGITKATDWHGIRIDHVLLGPGWECLEAWVGRDLGMDHRPMVTDLRWVGESKE
jgi:endonuclease/exonuclease/phosphatase (EEP) superfamily protein YafD